MQKIKLTKKVISLSTLALTTPPLSSLQVEREFVFGADLKTDQILTLLDKILETYISSNSL